MRSLLFILIAQIVFSCNNQNKESDKEKQMINGMTKEEWKQNYVDSVMKNLSKETLPDSTDLINCPVKVVNERLFKEAYSNYKSISLTFKNVSDKKIEAIRFQWYGEDAFGEPADMGGYGLTEGRGSGFDDDPLGPGKSRTSTWNILSSRGKKVVLAWAYEVAFSDGTKWELKQ